MRDDARSRLTATLGEDPFNLVSILKDIGRDKAEAEALAYRLEQERKPLLARLASEYATAHAKDGLSEARLERMARSDPRYQKHIEGTAAAIERRERVHSDYWAVKTRLTWLEKTVAHENALTRMDGG